MSAVRIEVAIQALGIIGAEKAAWFGTPMGFYVASKYGRIVMDGSTVKLSTPLPNTNIPGSVHAAMHSVLDEVSSKGTETLAYGVAPDGSLLRPSTENLLPWKQVMIALSTRVPEADLSAFSFLPRQLIAVKDVIYPDLPAELLTST